MRGGRSLANPTYEFGGALLGDDDFMANRHTGGLLILKHGEAALERHGNLADGNSARAQLRVARGVHTRQAPPIN